MLLINPPHHLLPRCPSSLAVRCAALHLRRSPDSSPLPPSRFRQGINLASRKPPLRAATDFRPSDPPESSISLPSEREEDGPIELTVPSPAPIFAVDDHPSPLQIATSALLTGAITVFLFRSIRRRVKRAKELRVRSGGLKEEKKGLNEDAFETLKSMATSPLTDAGKPPSPAQAMLGGIAAGVIALILYKFTLTVEAGLNRQSISDDFSIRQLTVTIRTIINGLCYLATFVFGVNSIGLFLYSAQLSFYTTTSNSRSTSTLPDDNSTEGRGPNKTP